MNYIVALFAGCKANKQNYNVNINENIMIIISVNVIMRVGVTTANYLCSSFLSSNVQVTDHLENITGVEAFKGAPGFCYSSEWVSRFYQSLEN